MIEAEESPFKPTYCEDGEPPFLTEWLEADESLQVLGYSCISMLAAALHLYLKTWTLKLEVPIDELTKSKFKKIGWFKGYKELFLKHFRIDFTMASANLAVLEEIVLVRNRVQHPDDIVTTRASYVPADIKKLPHVFFVDETERGLLSGSEETENSWLFPPSIHIDEEKFMTAIAEVENFSSWLESEIDSLRRD